MKSSKWILSLGLATTLLMGAVATTFGMQTTATPVKQGSMTDTTVTTNAGHTKRQTMAVRSRRRRSSAHTIKTSAKKTKRVPKAKSLSKLSY